MHSLIFTCAYCGKRISTLSKKKSYRRALLWFCHAIALLLKRLAVGLIVYYYLEIRPIAQTGITERLFLVVRMPQTRFCAALRPKYTPKFIILPDCSIPAGVDGHFRPRSGRSCWPACTATTSCGAMLAQAYYGRDSQGNAVYGTKMRR